VYPSEKNEKRPKTHEVAHGTLYNVHRRVNPKKKERTEGARAKSEIESDKLHGYG